MSAAEIALSAFIIAAMFLPAASIWFRIRANHYALREFHDEAAKARRVANALTELALTAWFALITLGLLLVVE